MAFYLKLEEGQPQQLAQTYKRYICLHLFKCDIKLHSGLLILYIYPRKAHLTRSKKKEKNDQKVSDEILTHSLFHASSSSSSSSSVSRVEHSLNLPVSLTGVQPLPALEDGRH